MHPKRRFVEYAYINDIPSVKEYIFLVIKDNEKICWKENQETIKKGFNKMYDAFFYAFIGFGDVRLFDKVTRNHKKAEQGKSNGNQIFWCIGNAPMSNNNNYCKNKL